MDTVVLYRPVGSKELNLIRGSGFKAFPPRLPDQPIFYPVLDLGYARQIAKDWNAIQNEDRRGYVTRFEVAAEYLAKHEVHLVGGRQRQEYWIPAEELPEFNANIVGLIQVVEGFAVPDPLKLAPPNKG
jgi:hypothetical protein